MTSHFTYTVHGSGFGLLLAGGSAEANFGPELSGELAAGIRGAELVEIDAGHGVVTEETADWLAAVLSFLSRLA
jgi:hypothetical protein